MAILGGKRRGSRKSKKTGKGASKSRVGGAKRRSGSKKSKKSKKSRKSRKSKMM